MEQEQGRREKPTGGEQTFSPTKQGKARYLAQEKVEFEKKGNYGGREGGG